MILGRYKILGHSMEPLLREGRIVFASSLFPIRKNNIVVFKKGSKNYIKRVTKIKDSLLFLEGDNKTDSLDSRRFGWVEKKDVIGKVILKI